MLFAPSPQVRVAVVREEGSNGDREMSAAVFAAGMEPWDITMSDLINGRASLDSFRGIIFVGGFSYADVMDSAKGWAGTIRFNEKVLAQFQAFYNRPDTFSLGICNGCQLMALLGWVPATAAPSGKTDAILPDLKQPRCAVGRCTVVKHCGSCFHVFVRASPSFLLECGAVDVVCEL